MNKYIYIITALLFYLTISIPVFSQNKEPLSKKNINEKIYEAYTILAESDDDKLVYEILEYLTLHKINIIDLSAKGRILYLEGTMRYNLNEPKKAKKLLNEAMLIAINNNDENLKAASLQTLGSVFANAGKNAMALDYYKQALEIFNRIDAKTQQIDVYFDITTRYRKTEKWEICKQSTEQAIALINKRNKKKTRLKYLYGTLALCNVHLNEYKEAQTNIDIAVKLTNNKNALSMKGILSTQALLYEKLGKFEEANIEYKKAIEAFSTNLVSNKNKLRKFLHKELELKSEVNKIKDKKIKQSNLLLYLSLLFLLFSILFILRNANLSKKIKKNNLKVKGLNHELQNSLINVKSTNLNLKNKNENIAHLLNLNERTLFSKILKISTYNDIVSKLANDLSTLIDSDIAIKPNDLFRIEKTLTSMVDEDEIWDDFQIQFEKTRPNFFKKLKQIASDLSINDLKHCSYIIAKLRTKDVANLINVSPRSVETTRYRIKKKVNLGKESSLYDFLDNL